jgi:hypothetical protein
MDLGSGVTQPHVRNITSEDLSVRHHKMNNNNNNNNYNNNYNNNNKQHQTKTNDNNRSTRNQQQLASSHPTRLVAYEVVSLISRAHSRRHRVPERL